MSDARCAYVNAMLASNVRTRFARFLVQADDRFRPPKTIVNGVKKGEIDVHVLQIWGMVVDKLGTPGQKLNYGGAVKYFQNKCAKMGYPLPPKYIGAGQGATHGVFKIKDGDQIEDWVKERLKSAGLLEDAKKEVQEQKEQVAAVQMTLEDLLKASVKEDKERQKQLKQAEKDVAAAAQAIEALEKAVEKHEDVDVPVISFEQQFQLLLHQAMNDLSRKEVLAQAKAVLAKFEFEMKAPVRMAGVLDQAGKMVGKLWDKVVAIFSAVRGWADDVQHSADTIDKLFASVK